MRVLRARTGVNTILAEAGPLRQLQIGADKIMSADTSAPVSAPATSSKGTSVWPYSAWSQECQRAIIPVLSNLVQLSHGLQHRDNVITWAPDPYDPTGLDIWLLAQADGGQTTAHKDNDHGCPTH
jgi:hypothetical protein